MFPGWRNRFNSFVGQCCEQAFGSVHTLPLSFRYLRMQTSANHSHLIRSLYLYTQRTDGPPTRLLALGFALSFQALGRAFPRGGRRCLLRARRTLLGRHGLKTTFATDLAAFPAQLTHDLGEKRFLLLIHTSILSGFSTRSKWCKIMLAPKTALGYSVLGSDVRLCKQIEH